MFIGGRDPNDTNHAQFKTMTVQTILGTAASETLFAPDDLGYTMKGKGGDDLLVGRHGNDVIRGGRGNDILEGYGGNDQLIGGRGNDFLYGDDGQDILKGKSGNDDIYGGPGFDILQGNRGNDYLYGGDNSDTLSGGLDNDMLYGEKGNDWLDGGRGDDWLNGGEGTDVFFLSKGQDTIMDYSVTEDSRIRIDADIFTEVSLQILTTHGDESLLITHNHGSTLLMGVDSSAFSIDANISFT